MMVFNFFRTWRIWVVLFLWFYIYSIRFRFKVPLSFVKSNLEGSYIHYRPLYTGCRLKWLLFLLELYHLEGYSIRGESDNIGVQIYPNLDRFVALYWPIDSPIFFAWISVISLLTGKLIELSSEHGVVCHLARHSLKVMLVFQRGMWAGQNQPTFIIWFAREDSAMPPLYYDLHVLGDHLWDSFRWEVVSPQTELCNSWNTSKSGEGYNWPLSGQFCFNIWDSYLFTSQRGA